MYRECKCRPRSSKISRSSSRGFCSSAAPNLSFWKARAMSLDPVDLSEETCALFDMVLNRPAKALGNECCFFAKAGQNFVEGGIVLVGKS